ncbi:MAG: hypothetical protein WAS56_04780, partial [Saprospiraceae bacterium]
MKYSLLFIGALLILGIPAFSQDTNQKVYSFSTFIGSGLSNQQSTYYEDQVHELNPSKRNTPWYVPGLNLGVEMNRKLNQKINLGLGLRFQIKGGTGAYYFLNNAFTGHLERIPFLMIQTSMQYWLKNRIALYNGLTIGTNIFSTYDFNRFEVALLTGLKFKLSHKFSSAVYLNHGLTRLTFYPVREQLFYSFDLSLYYNIFNF